MIYYLDNSLLNDSITNWKKGKDSGSSSKQCVKLKKKGEWEAKECSSSYGIVCDIPGLDCDQADGNTVIIGGHTCNANQICINNNGGYSCESCPTGHKAQGETCVGMPEKK